MRKWAIAILLLFTSSTGWTNPSLAGNPSNGASCQALALASRTACDDNAGNAALESSYEEIKALQADLQDSKNTNPQILCNKLKGISSGARQKLEKISATCRKSVEACIDRCGASQDPNPAGKKMCDQSFEQLNSFSNKLNDLAASEQRGQQCVTDTGGGDLNAEAKDEVAAGDGTGTGTETTDGGGGGSQAENGSGEEGGGGMGMPSFPMPQAQPTPTPNPQALETCLNPVFAASNPVCKCLAGIGTNEECRATAPQATLPNQGDDPSAAGAGGQDSFAGEGSATNASGRSSGPEFRGVNTGGGGSSGSLPTGSAGGAAMGSMQGGINKPGLPSLSDPAPDTNVLGGGRGGGGSSGRSFGGGSSSGSYDPMTGSWVPSKISDLKAQQKDLKFRIPPGMQRNPAQAAAHDPASQVLREPNTLIWSEMRRIYRKSLRLSY